MGLGDVSPLVVSAAGSRGGLYRPSGERRRRAAGCPDLCLPEHPGERFLRVDQGLDGVAPPVGAAYENIKLGRGFGRSLAVRPTTSETTERSNLKFDDGIALNLAGIPSCP